MSNKKEDPDKPVKQLCGNCKYWGDGDGTGMPYDAGHINDCNHPGISGSQHPSYGVMGERKTFVYVANNGGKNQYIQTRINFGCNQFEVRKFKK